jgi:CheY-like chemotaxis protein
MHPVRPLRVLVVDDNVDAAELLAELLRMAGHEVTVVHDGACALRAVEEVPPEMALLDIGLPGMDGYELAIRLADRLAGVHLVAVTGYGQEHDRIRAREAGFQRHFVKPVPSGDLLAYIASVSLPASPTEPRPRGSSS